VELKTENYCILLNFVSQFYQRYEANFLHRAILSPNIEYAIYFSLKLIGYKQCTFLVFQMTRKVFKTKVGKMFDKIIYPNCLLSHIILYLALACCVASV